ncbi:hypothetical protein D5S18_21920 [Nocardia panacis]|uniref:ABC transporter permease n=1 Tax=Nocardia panacis TaxID=2340916 RepID=A0A3A4KCF6_9NOCA|nr:ABC transporter permease subunit [Nocardia panacis]RJO72944.1 hypothetical protein D5S18_21920 [Nocardia panacis]
MKRTVFTQTLTEQRRGLIGWSAAFFLIPIIYLSSYKSLKEQGTLNFKQNKLYGSLGMSDFASGAGYLGSTVYSLLGLVLMLIFTVSFAARTVTQEENGSLDLLLARAIGRIDLLLQRFAALATQIVVVSTALTVGVLIGSRSGSIDVATGHVLAASAGLGMFALLIGSVTLLVGALTGKRTLTLGIAGLIGIASYLANNLGATIDGLSWLRRVSPVYYASGHTPLVNGWNAQLLALVVLVALACTAALTGFDRRDLAV